MKKSIKTYAKKLGEAKYLSYIYDVNKEIYSVNIKKSNGKN